MQRYQKVGIQGIVKPPVENSNPVNHAYSTPILKAPQPKASSSLAQKLKKALQVQPVLLFRPCRKTKCRWQHDTVRYTSL